MAKVKKIVTRLPIGLVLMVIALCYLFPLLITLTNSFMSKAEIVRHFGNKYDWFDSERALAEETHYAEYELIPEVLSPEQYSTLLFKTPAYLDRFVNSLYLTIPTILLQVVIGSASAYGFTVWRCKYKELLFCIYIIVMVLPFQATLVSNYIIAGQLGLLNDRLSVILPMGFSPFATFVLRQNMREIPKSVFEAAQMDGAGHLRRFWEIALPLSKGGLSSLVILSFADCWAMVEQPLIFLQDADMEPLSVALSLLGQEDMGLIFAASVFYMLPVVWLFLYGQEYFERGIKLSALR
ncbi:MAG: carbohydrate ABC transporter permease [Lachnospiraceae bacterium]|jgi:multiple sugar transport system permease protein|nr:carbohydrate ABC transporter permease [Lachnospiraceae bacterium]